MNKLLRGFNLDIKKYIVNWQGIRFLIVGGLNTLISYGFYYSMVHFNFNYILALTLSQIIGIIHSFFWNKFWTFKSKNSGANELLKFVTVYFVAYLVNLVLLTFFVEIVKIDKKIAPIIILFLTTVISFFGHKFWSFKK